MKVKLTVTLSEDNLKYLNIFADKHFEGNESMAMRYIITEHGKYSKKDNI